MAFDWNRARAFLATADAGSFSGAARALGTTQPTVGRQIAALEAELDVALFQRVGRGLTLTPTGLELVEHVRAMAEAALRFSRVAAGQSLSLDGPICISAGEVLAATQLPAIVRAIREQHPGIHIEILATNTISDLGRRQADIALRNVRPSQPELVAKKLREDDGFLYATPGYLASIGSPRTLTELGVADFVSFADTAVFVQYLNAAGVPITKQNLPWVTESQRVQWALITQGAGVGVMMAEVGDADPRVVRVLPDELRFPVPLWIASHREVRTSRRVRVVFDMLVEALKET